MTKPLLPASSAQGSPELPLLADDQFLTCASDTKPSFYVPRDFLPGAVQGLIVPCFGFRPRAIAFDRTRLAWRQPGTERRHDCVPIESKRSAPRKNGARRGHGESTDAPRREALFFLPLRSSSSSIVLCVESLQCHQPDQARQKACDAKRHGNCDSPGFRSPTAGLGETAVLRCKRHYTRTGRMGPNPYLLTGRYTVSGYLHKWMRRTIGGPFRVRVGWPACELADSVLGWFSQSSRRSSHLLSSFRSGDSSLFPWPMKWVGTNPSRDQG
jgi:hypothetical protein